MLVGAFVLAGGLYLLGARLEHTEALVESSRQRIVLENSRLLATQYMRQSVLAGSYSGSLSASIDGGETAKFTLASSTALPPLASLDRSHKENHFSPGGNLGYSSNFENVVLAGVFQDKEGNSFEITENWLFQARSGSPMFAFDLFTAQRQTLSPNVMLAASGIAVAGNVSGGSPLGANAMLWATNADFDLSAVTYQTPSGNVFPGGALGADISNFAFVPITSGSNAALASAYDGTLSTIDPGGWPYSIRAKAEISPYVLVSSSTTAEVYTGTDTTATPFRGVSCNGAGTVTIDLSDNSPTSPTSNNDLERILILGDPPAVSTIVIRGQSAVNDLDANNAAGLLITHVGSVPGALSIELQNDNNRRIYLAVKKPGAGMVASNLVTITATPSSGNRQWRLAGTFENAPVNFNLGSTLQIYGGFRTDASMTASGGVVNIAREVDPKNLNERAADRIVWLESYRQ